MSSGILLLVRPHTSLLDGPYVAWKLRGQRCLFPVDAEYARHPFWKRVLQAYGWLLGHRMVALDVSCPVSLRSLLAALQNGETVVLFPQGVGLSQKRRPDLPGWHWLQQRTGCTLQELMLYHNAYRIPTRLVPVPYSKK